MGRPHGTESSGEVRGHQFTATPISTVVRMLFLATWSSLGASMERAELGFSKVRIFQRVEDRVKGTGYSEGPRDLPRWVGREGKDESDHAQWGQ